MMEDLPSEMINEILLRLDKSSLFHASNVCKLWRCQALSHVVIINSKEQFRILAKDGDRLSIIKSARKGGWLDWGLKGACQGGH